MATPRHLTKTEIAVQVLRERIASGDLAGGRRLRVEELAEELEMSVTPVREALRLLQADGLVDYRAHYGIVVAAPSVDEMRNLFRLRSVLEPLAIELAVPRLDAAGLAQLERMHGRLIEAVRAHRGSAIAKSNSDWHWALYEVTGSPLLNDFIRRLWQAFPWRTMWALPSRAELSLEQHEEMMEAIRTGAAKRAAQLMRAHVTSGEESMLAQFAEREETARAS